MLIKREKCDEFSFRQFRSVSEVWGKKKKLNFHQSEGSLRARQATNEANIA